MPPGSSSSGSSGYSPEHRNLRISLGLEAAQTEWPVTKVNQWERGTSGHACVVGADRVAGSQVGLPVVLHGIEGVATECKCGRQLTGNTDRLADLCSGTTKCDVWSTYNSFR